MPVCGFLISRHSSRGKSGSPSRDKLAPVKPPPLRGGDVLGPAPYEKAIWKLQVRLKPH
ncbi:hypothetical protein J6590_054790 [Homalodisca vitripennis]|nr:hypothetical protein J6590_054790 [Homalodisca vitripennis]